MSLLCVGQVVADIVVRPVNGMPLPGTADTVEDIQFVTGGCAANTAAVAAKLGLPTRFAGLVGCDPLGDMVLAQLRASGVDIRATARAEATPTSAVIVQVDDLGERSFLYREGASEQFCLEHIQTALLDEAEILYVGGAMKTHRLDLPALLHNARERNCITCLDTDWDTNARWRQRLDAALPFLNYLLTNEQEGAMLSDEREPEAIAVSLLRRGPDCVIVKLGARGALFVTREELTHFPSFKVETVDTTCAGDCFAAGFLYGLKEGWEMRRTIPFANACGALSTTRISHTAILNRGSVDVFTNSSIDRGFELYVRNSPSVDGTRSAVL